MCAWVECLAISVARIGASIAVVAGGRPIRHEVVVSDTVAVVVALVERACVNVAVTDKRLPGSVGARSFVNRLAERYGYVVAPLVGCVNWTPVVAVIVLCFFVRTEQIVQESHLNHSLKVHQLVGAEPVYTSNCILIYKYESIAVVCQCLS